MISQALYGLSSGLRYVASHQQLWFALILLVLLPLLFLYSSQTFLEIGRANQDRLQKDRVGILHDAFVTNIHLVDGDLTRLQAVTNEIVALNPDIVLFEIYRFTEGSFQVALSTETERIDQFITNASLVQAASVRQDESLIFPMSTAAGRTWQALRATQTEDGQQFVLLTSHDLSTVDQVLQAREQRAYYMLALVYLFLILFAWWHIRNTDYGRLYAEVKQANETKDLFTNMIAHELRAPLTAIRGYASLVEESTQLSKQHHQSVQRITSSSERLLTIVNDLLDVARIQSGKLSVESRAVALRPIIDQAIAELAVSAAEHSLTIEAPEIPEVQVQADPERLQQVLINLLSNAIKYTPEGTISVGVTTNHRTCELRIKDTGMGIAAADQKKLFAPFHRVNADRVDQITGSGLGMWITRQLLELMGGTVAVESIKNVGTHVVVTLPLAKT